MKLKFKKILSSKEFIRYLLFVAVEFTISTINFYLSNYSNDFEIIIEDFGSLEGYIIGSVFFSIFFPLLISLLLILFSKIIPFFKKGLLKDATKIVLLIIILDLITLILNIFNPI